MTNEAYTLIPLLIEFVAGTSRFREPDLLQHLPILHNGLPGTFVIFQVGARIVAVAVPAFALSRLPGFELRWIWYLSVAAGTLQLAMNLLLLRREFRRRLNFAPALS